MKNIVPEIRLAKMVFLCMVSSSIKTAHRCDVNNELGES
jgi:hypothetical protein